MSAETAESRVRQAVAVDPTAGPHTAAGPEVEAWREELERALASPGTPAWLQSWRRQAFEAFARRGYPGPRDEDWRHTSLAGLARIRWSAAPEEPAAPADLLRRLSFDGAWRARELVRQAGRPAPALSSLETQAGLSVSSWRAAAPGEGQARLAELERQAGEHAAHPFAALNAALSEDTLLLELAPGCRLDGPLHLLHVAPRSGAAHVRTELRLGRGACLHLVETYGGAAEAAGLTTAVTHVRLEEGATLDLTTLQREGLGAFHLGRLAVRQAPGSVFRHHAVDVGAALARHDIEVRLEGERAACSLDGLFLADGAQQIDTHSRIEHLRPRGTSRELYKGVLTGRARAVFNGLVVVHAGAQQSDAWQANRNLLLSDAALVHSTPQLEIHADDVKCKHGSTTGQLDPQALFYLRSRGLGEDEARALLTYAFASEIVQRLELPAVRERLTTYLHERLPRAPQEEPA